MSRRRLALVASAVRRLALAAAAVVAACADPAPAELDAGAAPRLHDPTVAAAVDDLPGGFVPGEVMVELDRDPDGPIVVGGVALAPIARQPSGVWRMAIVDQAHARRAVGLDGAARLAAEHATAEAIARVAAAPGVRRAYRNLILELSAHPTDPLYASQRWHYDAIRLPAAWDLTRGHPGVRLAIIDTELGCPAPGACNRHPDLAPNLAPGADFVTSGATLDYHHGVAVAGIAGAAADNGIGIAGVCHGCTLVPLRISGSLSASLAELELAVDHAAGGASGPPRAEVVNISANRSHWNSNMTIVLGCDHEDVVDFAAAVARAVARGVPVVVSSGNISTQPQVGFSGPAFPANCPGVIAVTATDPTGAIPTYARRGATIDGVGRVALGAPGGGFAAGTSLFGPSIAPPPVVPCTPVTAGAYRDAYTGAPSGVATAWADYEVQATLGDEASDYCYRHIAGTSFAAPHVTGVIGLMRARNGALTLAQIRDILARTAQRDTPCTPGACGDGLVDAAAAVRFAPLGGVPVPSAAPVAFGDVAAGTSAIAHAQVANPGSATLVLGAMVISGGAGQLTFAFPSGCTGGTICTSPPPAIAPGGVQAIPLRCAPGAAGPIAATLSVNGNGLPASIPIAVTCSGVAAPPDVALAPTAIAFGAVSVGMGAGAQARVRNDGGGTLSISTGPAPAGVELACVQGCTCSASGCTASLGAGQEATLGFTYRPSAPGSLDATFAIASNDADEPSVGLRLTGTATQPNIRLSPSELHLGAVQVGTERTGVFHVINTGTEALRVTSVSMSSSAGGVFSLVAPALPLTIAPGTAAKVALRCRPLRYQSYATQVTVVSNAPFAAPPVFVRCSGIAPGIAVTASPGWSLGDLPVGATRTATVYVHNTLSNLGMPLAWSVSAPPPPFSLACTSGCTCAGGVCSGSTSTASAQLQLTYAPTAAGSHTAPLTFTSNDPDRAILTHHASGRAYVPLVVDAPAGGTLRLSSPPGTTSAPGTVTIRNSGLAPVAIAGVAVTGPGASAYAVTGPAPTTLAPGAAASWQVTCTPIDPPFDATLLVVHDAPVPGSAVPIVLECYAPVAEEWLPDPEIPLPPPPEVQ